MIDLFHFTPVKLANRILMEGITPQSKYSALNSEFRQGVSYAWLRPEHDLMGYYSSPDYLCLKLHVSRDRCKVVNMDMISAAFVNHVGAGREKNPALAKQLICNYERTAVNPGRYQPGQFRAPEVVIFGAVEPGAIAVYSNPVPRPENRNICVYYSLWQKRLQDKYPSSGGEVTDIINRLESQGRCRQVAIHDDSTGLLATYYLEDFEEFLTCPITESHT